MRAALNGNVHAQEFANRLLMVGEDQLPKVDGMIDLAPNLCSLVISQQELIEKVFPDLLQNVQNLARLSQRGILCPQNDAAAKVNLAILERLLTLPETFHSIDTVMDQEEVVQFPVEFLNSLSPGGFPPHELSLKVGAPIMLIRNLHPPKLCNGTRLQLKWLYRNMVEATIMTGPGAGEDVFIPRIPLIATAPIQFKRVQFPFLLSFAFTINKSQGQSLSVAGVHLKTQCFSHGQLYVALLTCVLSRWKSRKCCLP